MTRQEKIEALRKASLLLQEKGWTQGCFARDKEGKGVNPTSKNAICFCIAGACIKTLSDCSLILTPLSLSCGNLPIGVFNDLPGRKLSDVTAAFVLAEQYCEDDPS